MRSAFASPARFLAAALFFAPLFAPLFVPTSALGAAQAEPATGSVRSDHITVELVAAQTAAIPGEKLTVALRMLPDEHWHTYWRNPGDSGLATTIDWTLPPGVTAGPIQWPYPERQALGPLTNYGYSGEHYLLTELSIPPTVSGDLTIVADAAWLVCEDICIPGDARLALELPVAQRASSTDFAAGIAEALLRVPVRSTAAARFSVAEGMLTMQAELPAPASVQAFFPITAEVIDNVARPQLGASAELLQVRAPLSDFFSEAPAEMAAVLVLDDGTAVEVNAGPAANGALAPASGFTALATTASAPNPGNVNTLPHAPSRNVFIVLLMALVGGLILNLMPCVFPVLSIKAIAVAQSSTHGGGERRAHALAYTAGVVLGFVTLAAAMLTLRAAGQAVGWGFQLQSPWVVGALAYLMFLLGLSLHGYFTLGTRLMGVGQGLTERPGNSGAFFTGLLACVVATPCTAPFMGAAMGFAVTQSAIVALLVFAALGVGMALPFLALGFVPGLAKLLPRPGAWMDTFKQVMAFPLYLTAAWLAWVLGQQAGINGMAALLVGAVLLVVAIWVWPSRERHGVRRGLSMLTAAALSAASIALLFSPWMATTPVTVAQTGDAKAYTPQALQTALDNGTPVFINLTAAWCVTCHVNERVALQQASVRDAMAEANIVYLKGDWTNRDPQITALLEQYNRSGVPLYLLYSGRAGEAPTVLPQILTPGIVLDAIRSL